MQTIYSVFLILLFTLNIAIAQEGPFVPCVGCDNLSAAPFPETGLWSNPDQSPGSGLSFEIQNGVLAGFVFTYTPLGEPDWLMVNGTLVRSQKEGVLWELETRLTRVEGGSCLSCLFTAPDQFSNGMNIRLEFMQRNYLRISIGGVFDQFFVPFTYGSGAHAYFSGHTPYLLPTFSADVFSFVVKDSLGQTNWWSFLANALTETVTFNEGRKTVQYEFHSLIAPLITPPIPPLAIITCTTKEANANPFCELEADGRIYSMPIGNFGGSRFSAEAEDGSVIEGFRVDYD